MSNDRPVLGLFLMLGFCVLAPFGDALAKLLGQTWPLLPLVFARFAIQFAVLLPISGPGTDRLRLSPRGWRLTVLRTLLHVSGIALIFEALRHLPLADAIAIAYVMPFVMLLLGWAVLGETVGSRRLMACAVGFAGTLMVVQPAFAQVGAAALLPVGVAVVFALFMLVTRMVAHEADPLTLQTVSGGIATCLLLPVILIFTDWSFVAATTGMDWTLVLLLGLVGTVAHLFLTWSLRFAPAATLAPIQYLEIPVAAAIGWLMFREFPNGLALVGICATILAGIYVILREQRLARDAGRPSPEAKPPVAE